MNRRRLVIVSNRLPITTKIDGDQITFSQASGGVATGLRGCHERSGGVWIGWARLTSRVSKAHRTMLDRQLGERGIVPLPHAPGSQGILRGLLQWRAVAYLPLP